MWWSCHPGGSWQDIVTVDEFGAGHTDACGPDANENLQACMEGSTPTYAHMDAIRSFDMANGHFKAGSGQTITDIDWDLGHWSKLDHTHLWPYQPNLQPYTADQINAALVRCGNGTDTTGKQPGGLILIVGAGHNLPYNEPNVNVHIVAALCYDSVASNMGGHGAVYLANGDREPLPKGTGKPDWCSIPQLASANVLGMLEVYTKLPVAPPPNQPPPDIAGAIDDISMVQSSVANVIAALQNAEGILQDARRKLSPGS